MKKFITSILAIALTMSMALPASAYSDVQSHWASEAIAYVSDAGYFSGTGDGSTFSPDVLITRAGVVTALQKFNHSTDYVSSGSISFTDVVSGKWYTTPVLWAAENGIVSGNASGEFHPGNNISRQDFCVIVRNYFQYLEKNFSYALPDASSPVSFSDAGDISSYAADAVDFCSSLGIISGYSDGAFHPKDNVTRGQAAAIFQKLVAAVSSLAGITDSELIENGPVASTPEDAQTSGSGAASGIIPSSGGASGGSGASQNPSEPTEDEKAAEEKATSIFGKIADNYSSVMKTYKIYNTVYPNVESALDILVDCCRSAADAHDAGTFVSRDYVNETYSSQIDQIRSYKNSFSDDEYNQFVNLAHKLDTDSDELRYICDYMGVSVS